MTPHKLEVRFADIDAMGHVNNAIYLNYFEEGRIQFFKEMIGGEWNWKSMGIIVARNEIDYLKPLFLGDEAYVHATVGEVGNKSFQMKMRVFKKADDQEIECVRGVVTLVCFDHQKQTTIPVPDAWRALAEK